MQKFVFLIISHFTFMPVLGWAQEQNDPVLSDKPVVLLRQNLEKTCVDSLKNFKEFSGSNNLQSACAKVMQKEGCESVDKQPIFHFDRNGTDPKSKKILVFSLIHGDETGAGSAGRYWMERLEAIEPRNQWRVIPVLNPDGVKNKTRTNANKIDLNRNFPTRDWDELAQKYWKLMTSSNSRRFPGDKAGSEPEVKCALSHIEEFRPDFVVSIHTPLNVLDFDGPKVKPPNYSYLPWKSLGHFPGSLGRWLWFERSVPVLTVELKPSLPKNHSPFDQLQDVIGTLVKYEIKTAPKDSH